MRGLAEHGLVVAAREVADLRAFDLDDARAQIGQLPRGEWRGHGLFERDDGYSLEGEHRLSGKPELTYHEGHGGKLTNAKQFHDKRSSASV